jgi:hypothetical protein
VAFVRFLLGIAVVALFALQDANAVEPILLNFGDLVHHPIGPHGLEISANAKNMQGQNIRLRGFMVKSEEDAIGQFYLAPVPLQTSEHADGPANDLPASAVLVKLDPSQANWAVSHKAGALVLEGTLLVGRHEDAQGTVSWFQLQLPIH